MTTQIPADYWNTLKQAIAARVNGVAYDEYEEVISVAVSEDSTLFCSPMYEGEALPWHLHVDRIGGEDDFGKIDAQWTGVLADDVATYETHLASLLERFGAEICAPEPAGTMDENQIRLLRLFASTCEWRKITPIMVESWTSLGLVEEVPDSIDPGRTLGGEAYRLFRMTPKGQDLIA